MERGRLPPTRVCHFTMPSVRIQFHAWEVPDINARIHDQERVLRQLLRIRETQKQLLSNPIVQIVHQWSEMTPFKRMVEPGMQFLLLLHAGSEIICDSATHTGRCYLPTDRLVIVGTAACEEIRHAQLGVDGQFSIAVEGPAPEAVWLVHDDRRLSGPIAEEPRTAPNALNA